jgi:hypothetical protein
MDGRGNEAFDELFDRCKIMEDHLIEKAKLEFLVKLLPEHDLLRNQGEKC